MTAINIHIEESLYNQAFPILEHHGLTASQAFRLFLSQVVKTKTIPNANELENQTMPSIQATDAENQSLKIDNATLENLSGIRPFTGGKHTITNEMVTQIREQEGI